MKPFIGAALAILVASVATAAAAQDSRPYDAAVAARQSGDPARAEALLEPWIAAHPEDVDARLQLGFARLALGELDAAEADFRSVLAAAPDYVDAREGLERVAAARRAGKEERRGAAYVEGALTGLSGDRESWREVAVGAVIPAGTATTLDARVTHYRRFGLNDLELAAGATARVSSDTWVRGGALVAPSADFRPQWGGSLGFDHRISRGATATLVGADMRFQRFPLQDVVTFAPYLTQYFERGKFAVTLRPSATFVDGGNLQPGGLARVDYIPTERLRAHVGAAFGPDTDLGVSTDTRSLFAGAEVPIGRRLSVTAVGMREWREDGFDRTEGRLGLKIGF